MDPETPAQRTEQLAAVLLDTLVREGPDGLDAEQAVRKVERYYDSDEDRAEVLAALDVLVNDGLALREADGGHWRPTRAALAAARLSF